MNINLYLFPFSVKLGSVMFSLLNKHTNRHTNHDLTQNFAAEKKSVEEKS